MREQATHVTYNAITREATITFANGVQVVLPLVQAVRLGDQLVNLIRPIDLEINCHEAV